MPTPSSGPISGSQIASAISPFFTVNLSLSGMVASSSLDIESPYAYSDFYGYPPRVSVNRYGSTVTKPAFACNNNYGYAVAVWFVKAPGAEGIEEGDFCYTSSTGDTVLANGNYAIGVGINSKPQYVITIANGTGYVSAVFTCGP
jgi:hypothetical protein